MSADLRNLGREQAGPIVGILESASGTIAAADTSQELMEANTERSYLLFQNLSDADMWLVPGDGPATAGQPSIKIAAGQTFQPWFVDRRAWQIICDTADAPYTCYEG